jgi:small-conductance mechanosensitive channel
MDWIDPWLPALGQLAAVFAALVGGWIAYRLIFRGLSGLAQRAPGELGGHLVSELRPGARLVLPMLTVQLAMPALTAISAEALAILRHVLLLLAIAGVTWLMVGGVAAVGAFVRSGYDVQQRDNLAARRVHTQVLVLERAAAVLIILFGVGLALMTFPRVRELGTGLLASAGVVGLVIGLAARPLLENMIAGLQLALTQPIRIDDVVIVKGEWGRVEEITTTYVVVRIWDERRLIVPFAAFIQESFQNWTRRSSQILGTVFLYADYTVPVEAVRSALQQIVRESPLWDGRVCNLQVTNATEQTVELRALVSAADSGEAWELRVYVREKLLAYLQREHPGALPRARVVLTRERGEGGPAPA